MASAAARASGAAVVAAIALSFGVYGTPARLSGPLLYDDKAAVMRNPVVTGAVPLLDGAARGRLDPAASVGWEDAAVCVVLASQGYPRSYPTGLAIEGLDALAEDPDVVVFHAGTKRSAGGGFETAGGRVVGVTARGSDVAAARSRAYAAAERVRFDGRTFRRDIADRALGR